MAKDFRLQFQPSLPQALHAAALAQLDQALEQLAHSPLGTRGVHQTRKACKRLRAWLRLLEPLPELSSGAQTRVLEHGVRDAARQLSVQRDHAVLRDTLKGLAQRHEQLRDTLGAPLRRLPRPAAQACAHQAADAHTALAQLRPSLAGLDLRAVHPGVLEQGLRDSYRAARRGMLATQHGEDAKALHDWRKAVRRHTEQCLLLAPLWPALDGHRALQLKSLNDALGRHHDLADCSAGLGQLPLTPEQAQVLEGLIREEQIGLHQQAHILGKALFQAKAQHWRPGA